MQTAELDWKQLFQHAQWGVVIGSADGKTLDAMNPAFARMHGCTPEELIGRPIASVFAPAFRDQVEGHVHRTHRDGRHIFEAEHVRKDGSVFPVQVDATAVKDPDGNVLYRAVYVQDITERKCAERALQESAALSRERLAELELIYATAPVGLALHDSEFHLLRINERLASIDGLPVEAHLGKRLGEILPSVAGVVEPILQRVIETGEPVLDLELSTKTLALPSIIALVSFYPLKTEDGRVRAVTTVVQDITERKRAEQAQRESEERLARILESAMDAIVTVDEGRAVTLFNAAAETVFRCAATEAMGRPFDRFASPGLRELLERYVGESIGSGIAPRYVWAPEGLSALRADGEAFPIEATLSRAEAGGRALYTLILRDVNERRRAEEQLRALQAENVYLREEVETGLEFGGIVGTSRVIREVLDSVKHVAETDSTVLITGETGTGKELIAKAIHARSRRKDHLLVNVNCAALPAGLIESELFGHEKGAFTGALSRKIGRFEMAHGGTLFLDEIGDLPLELQAKLLRVLQEGEFERVGGAPTLRVDVRVIAATNRDLHRDVKENRFRADLFYRLNVFPIALPPLRERPEDITLLARHLAMKYAAKMGKRIESISAAALGALRAYAWPGNVRELQNVIERGVILSRGPELEIGAWPSATPGDSTETRTPTLDELERKHILDVLEQSRWRVSGERGAARILGVKPTTLEARMKKLGIQRPT